MSEEVKVRQRRVVSEDVPKEEESITPDSAFENLKAARNEYEEAEKDLVKFVERQIELMKSNLLWGGREPSFFELQKSLSEYESVAVGLTSLYCTARIDRDVAQEEYDDAYATWFVQERETISSLGEKKMPSTREIDMIVRTKYMKDLAKLKAACINTETKRSLAERLVKNWEQYSFVLNTISRNAVAEANASGVSKDREEFQE